MKIIGTTVGTTIPKPNFDQTDPRKGDYIKGDRSFLRAIKTINGVEPDDNGDLILPTGDLTLDELDDIDLEWILTALGFTVNHANTSAILTDETGAVLIDENSVILLL